MVKKKGLAKHSLFIMLLDRLAVDLRWQKQGVGAALLKDATLRTLQAADIAGIRALVVHSKDDVAKTFYERFDFSPVAKRSLAPLHAPQRYSEDRFINLSISKTAEEVGRLISRQDQHCPGG
jgi:predicted N-acetyltransferase YhbS